MPCRLGGIGIANPAKASTSEYAASQQVTKPLSDLILQQNPQYSFDTLEAQLIAKSNLRSSKRQQQATESSNLKSSLPASLQYSMSLAQESGASSWLTTLPIEEFGFALHKGAFRDALALRYGWCPVKVPSHCACGQPFSVSHALSCHMGGYPSIRHNEIRDLTADLMSVFCHGVSTEPHLQPVDGEILRGASANTSDGARLDIAANGLWGEGLSEHFLMLGFLICTLPQTVDSNLLLAIAITKMQRSVHTNKGLGKLNMPHLSPSSCLSLVGWVASPQQPINV